MLKKLYSLVAILGIIAVSNCSRIPDNNDPIIGIWSDESLTGPTGKSEATEMRQEWIFNDAYLGRYHAVEKGKVITKTDFKWSVENNVYTISYPGLDREDDVVEMISKGAETMLETTDGAHFAMRE